MELGRTVLFLSSHLAPHGQVTKALLEVKLETIKLLLFVDAVVGLKLLATTLADKHMATVLPNYVLLSFLWALAPHTDPLQKQHDFSHKPALDIFRYRCQQMSAALHVLLKAGYRTWSNG